MKYNNKFFFLIIFSILISCSNNNQEEIKEIDRGGALIDKIIYEVRTDITIAIKDVADGRADLMASGIDGSTYLSLSESDLEKLDTYAVPSGSWSLLFNPVPNKAPYTVTTRDGKTHFNPLAINTNTTLKAMAAQGAPHGTVVAALEQTAGRGTRGRTFSSPPGGLYLSLLLRPQVELAQLFSLTGWVAVAVRDAVEQACGAPARIKWLNDIYLNHRKLCGILTELSLLGESSEPDYVVVGVGINLAQSAQTFRDLGLAGIATSLALEGYPVEVNHMALTLLRSLHTMAQRFPQDQEDYLQAYRAHCLTLHQPVEVEEGRRTYPATARAVLPDFSLEVVDGQGNTHPVSSGRVTPLSLHPNSGREDTHL